MEEQKVNVMEEQNAVVLDEHEKDPYFNRVHRVGRFFSLLAILTFFVPVVGVALIFGVKMEWGPTGGAIGQLLMIFGVIGFTEFVSFSPILGPGGSYLTYITGNITTMKLPCAQTAMRVANAQPGTKKADIVTILSVGISSIISTSVCMIGMVFISLLYPVLSQPVLAPGFSNMVPALIGAMSAPYILGNPRIMSVPTVLMFASVFIFGIGFIGEYDTWFSLAFMIIAALWAFFLFKKGKISEGKS